MATLQNHRLHRVARGPQPGGIIGLLAVIFGTFGTANRQQQRAARLGRQMRHRAERRHFRRIQRERLVQIAAPDRLQIVKPADRANPAHQPRWQIARQVGGERRPLGLRRQRRQMAARRMAGQMNPRPVTTQRWQFAVKKTQRRADIRGDCRHPLRRRKPVAQHRHSDPGGNEQRCDMAEMLLVQRLPVAAMNEGQHRCVALRGRKEIQPLPRIIAIGQVEIDGEMPARLGAARRPAVDIGGMIRHHRPVVILGIEPGLVVVAIGQWRRLRIGG